MPTAFRQRIPSENTSRGATPGGPGRYRAQTAPERTGNETPGGSLVSVTTRTPTAVQSIEPATKPRWSGGAPTGSGILPGRRSGGATRSMDRNPPRGLPVPQGASSDARIVRGPLDPKVLVELGHGSPLGGVIRRPETPWHHLIAAGPRFLLDRVGGCFRPQGETPAGIVIQLDKATSRRKVTERINIRMVSPAPPKTGQGQAPGPIASASVKQPSGCPSLRRDAGGCGASLRTVIRGPHAPACADILAWLRQSRSPPPDIAPGATSGLPTAP